MKKGILLLTVTALALVGCVSTLPKKGTTHSPALRLAGNSEGRVTIEWDSDSSYYYTVYSYIEKKNQKNILRKLPQATSIRGTGKTITIHDKIRYGTPIPQYRLRIKRIH